MRHSTEIFDRTLLLVGDEVFEAFQEARVILFGVGGVGSWCAEGLVRSGVRKLTIVDNDVVCTSNINRQLMATTKTVGRPKVEVLRERLLDINPEAEITALQEIYSEETAAHFQLETYDYVIDAIDSLRHKVQLILHATSLDCKFYSAMGAALKMDPTRVQVDEFWKVQYCPLARMIRKRMKQLKQYPGKKFQCVYSREVLPNTGETDGGEDQWSTSKAQTNGSMAHITAIFGFTLAGLVVEEMYRQELKIKN